MDIWENASLTEKGVDLHNRLINGKTLKITKVKTGAGKVPVMYLRQQTEVTNPMQELTLQPATISDDNIIIPVLLENIGLTESYELWQVGFYAEDPDEGEILYCIAQAAKGKDIPTEHESPGYSIVWNFHFKNSEENPFELNITPAGLVSMETLKKHTSDVNIHVTQEEKNAFYDKYTRSEVDNKFAALETNIDWKEAVDTYTDIMEMYPKPQDGWTVNVKDTDYTYRYNGTDWIAISSNAIPKATPALDGLMSKEQAVSLNKLEQAVGSLQNLTTSEKQNLVGAVNEVKSEVVQLNSDLNIELRNKANQTDLVNINAKVSENIKKLENYCIIKEAKTSISVGTNSYFGERYYTMPTVSGYKMIAVVQITAGDRNIPIYNYYADGTIIHYWGYNGATPTTFDVYFRSLYIRT